MSLSQDPSRILLVDDERQITRVLRMACTANGYAVDTATNAEAALEIFERSEPDLVITDLSMPGMDGVQLCTAIRARSMVPIIVLSVRDQEKVKVQALDAGADDYVTKPFQMEELLARVRSALRRATYPTPSASHLSLLVGDFRLEIDRHQAFLHDKEIHLTPKEFDLLHHLVLHPDRVLTHRGLIHAVWGGRSVDQPESLRVLVGQLRRKIEPSEKPFYLVTEPWVGYRFLPTGSADPSL